MGKTVKKKIDSCNSKDNCCRFNSKKGGYIHNNTYYCSYKCFRSNKTRDETSELPTSSPVDQKKNDMLKYCITDYNRIIKLFDVSNDKLNEIRAQWSKGDTISIYSISLKKWCTGLVDNIYHDNDGEWLIVSYEASVKEINRFDVHIRPSIPSLLINNHNLWSQKYKLNEQIGKGGEGTIYTTIENNNKITKVTKVYDLSNDSQNEYVKSIKRIVAEYIIFQQLQLINLYEIAFGPNNNKNKIYMTMEYFQYDVVKCVKKKSHKNVNIYDFTQQICLKLRKLNKNGYIHLDITPDNIMYGNNNKWHIVDGGCLQVLNENNQCILPNITGKLYYTPPEIISKYSTKNFVYGEKSDIFSLGLIILFILTDGYEIFKHVLYSSFKTQSQIDSITENYKNNRNAFYKYYCNNVTKNAETVIQKLLSKLKLHKKISHEFYELLLKMLDYNPKNRPNIDQILHHQMFKS